MKTVVLADSSDPVGYQRFEKAILDAIDFYQFYYSICDISHTIIDNVELKDTSLIILAQEGLGRKLGPADWRAILKQVVSGAGLAVVDASVSSFESHLLKDLGIFSFKSANVEEIITEDSWITAFSAETHVCLKQPTLSQIPDDFSEEWKPFLQDGSKRPIALNRKLGKGRIVVFFLSSGIWHDLYLGRGCGLDGVFWRALVYAARKPFIFKGMPPFVACRVNDASGSGESGFSYLDALNEAGFIPHVGLYIRDIERQHVGALREKFHEGKAEFSAHAFSARDDIWPSPIYLKNDGTEFTPSEMKRNFDEIDTLFDSWNIKPAQTINAHRSQLGLASIPFLKERKQTFAMHLIRPGKLFSDVRAHRWEPKPFGRPEFCLDSFEEAREIFNGVSRPARQDAQGATGDFLSRGRPAVEEGLFEIMRGLENLTFGCITINEPSINALAPGEFERIIHQVYLQLRRVPHIFKPYDFILHYAKNRTDSLIRTYSFENNRLTVTLVGKSTLNQFLFLFHESNGDIKQSFLEIPPFERILELDFKIPR
jgi:hypothetical protein